MGFDPSNLRPRSRARFPGYDGLYSIVTVEEGPYWDFIVRTDDGGVVAITLREDEVDQIELVAETAAPTFGGDPRLFRLGVEAHRIRNAFEHDMAGLAVSVISPYPHQLEAVYGMFLAEPRLRFLLADDPGAGKTIMAGLYVKELQLRRAADRVLIVTPANLRPQWQRELADRFDIHCTQFDRATFNAHPTQNPWDVHDLVVVSRDFLYQDDVLEAFNASEREWDLAIVDEAHGFTLQVDAKGHINKRTQRYKAAERVAARAHRLILLTATPHSGRTESLWGLLRLLDADAYGDRCPKRDEFEINRSHYRRYPKERMVDMTGTKLFRPRHPKTIRFDLVGPELDLYNTVTNFVSRELAEIRRVNTASTAGFALTTMQRRLASSIRAIRRTIERRCERLEKALEDPAAYLRSRQQFRAELEIDEALVADLDEDARWRLEEEALERWLPDTEQELRDELTALQPLLAQAQATEEAGVETKLSRLFAVIDQLGLRDDRNQKLLVFTEHKDTLDHLVDKLMPDFEVAVIHGGMGLRDRIAAEKRFREEAQIMVATEAAGEGINLQFCHLMVNYDIPWNPNRLEQRMGRVHRIGQQEDVHIFNLVAQNTREGFVLGALLAKIEFMGHQLGEKVFDVIGEIFADRRIKDLIERVLAKEITQEEAVASVGGTELDPETTAKFNALMQDALASDHLDWQFEAERAARAEERRLPPGYLQRFFEDAIDHLGGTTARRLDHGTIRVTRTPDQLVARSREAATREVFPSYDRITFDRAIAMRRRAAAEERSLPEPVLCGPGHPLFDALVAQVIADCGPDLDAGSTFRSPDVGVPTVVYFLTSDTVDANGELVHRAFASILAPTGGVLTSSRVFLYDQLLGDSAVMPEVALPEQPEVVTWARQHEFEAHFTAARSERERVAEIQERFLTKSFAAILARQEDALLDLDEQVEKGAAGAEGRLRQAELTKAQMIDRRARRLDEVARGRQVRRGPVRVLAVAVLVPGGVEDDEPGTSAATRYSSQEIERIAVEVAMRYENEVRKVDFLKSVERDNIGFDLLSVKGIDRRCIEVKGRAGVAMVELTWSEFVKAIELGADYWLYVVLDCSMANPRLYRVKDPARTLAPVWQTNLDIRYRVEPQPVIDAAEDDGG